MQAAGRRYIQHPSRTDEISLWGIGDIHLGANGADIKSVKRDVAAIKADPKSFWVGLGDYADYISPRDKRFDPSIMPIGAKLRIGDLGQYYMEEIRDLFAPIKHKCLGLLYGNHEQKYFIDNNRASGHGWLCTELGVPNLQYSSLMDVVFVRTPGKKIALLPADAKFSRAATTSASMRLYLHHGCGGAATPGGKLNTLIKLMNAFAADVYMMGHVHDQKAQRMVRIGANAKCTELEQKQTIGLICGSYLKTYTKDDTSYGEVKGYAPTSLGAARLWIKPETMEFRAEV